MRKFGLRKQKMVPSVRLKKVPNKLWFCKDCNYKAKRKHNLKTHIYEIHGTNHKWFFCQFLNCTYKSKRKRDVKRHRKFVHDIGENECEFCFEFKNSSIYYVCPKINKKTKICKSCYFKVTGKKSRDEKIWSDFLDKNFGKKYLISSDTSLKKMDISCSLKRPDKLYFINGMWFLLELDEHEHKYNNGNYTCDEKRITDIYDCDKMIGKKMVVIRINPDKYIRFKNQNREECVPKMKRYKKLVEILKRLIEFPPVEMIHIYYLFYSFNNPRICKNLPKTLIW
jgi:hypothetical protein